MVNKLKKMLLYHVYMCINARSICNKTDDLLVLVEGYKLHIIAVTESWYNSDIFDPELDVPGYDLFRMDRPLDNRCGGVLLYVNGDLVAVEWSPKTSFLSRCGVD